MHQWYFSYDGKQIGPLETMQAIAQAARQPDGYAWRDGFAEWMPIRQVADLSPVDPRNAGVERDAAVLQANHTRSKCKRQFDIVQRDDQRIESRGKRFENGPPLRIDDGRHRFVRQKNIAAAKKRARNGGALLLTAGERFDALVDGLV